MMKLLWGLISFLSVLLLSNVVSIDESPDATTCTHNEASFAEYTSSSQQHELIESNSVYDSDFSAKGYINDFITLHPANFTKVIKQNCEKGRFLTMVVVFHTSSCSGNNALFSLMEEAGSMIEASITAQNERFKKSGLGWETTISLPLYAKVPVDELFRQKSYFQSWLRQFDLSATDEYPALRIIQVEHLLLGSDDEVEYNYQLQSLAFMGSIDNVQDLVDGTMHYLTRLVLSAYYYDDTTVNNWDQTLETLPVHLFPSKLAVFAFSTDKSFFQFLRIVGQDLYHNVSQDLNIVSGSESAYMQQLLAFEDEALKEPYIAFVQCRSSFQTTNISWYEEFESLAEVYIHRRDVAFFVFVARHDSSECRWFLGNITESDLDGAVQVVRIQGINGEDSQPIIYYSATFIPSALNTDLSMRNFIVFHSTPSILWYDRFTSAVWAFHHKRKIHVVLFVDLHSLTLGDATMIKSFNRTKVAVNALRKESLAFRRNRPQDDIVFLLIPSTEIRIMRTFGIDIWSPMDEVMTGGVVVSHVVSELLPLLVVTSKNESFSYTKRFSLKPSEYMRCNADHSDCDGNYTDLRVSSFLNDVFDGRAIHDLKSQSDPMNRTNDSGVITLTGKTFQTMMGNLTTDTLIQFYSPWCGHCKRFQVIWNKLARLVRFLNISLDIMKIDVTENDVFHPDIDLEDVPSVYYFSKQKDRPIPLPITGDSTSSALKSPQAIIEWVMKNGKFDRNELLQQLMV